MTDRTNAGANAGGFTRKPNRPDATTLDGSLWQGLMPEIAEAARHLLATLSPEDALALGTVLVRESIARGATDRTHRATFSSTEVATREKVSPALTQKEIESGALPASKIGITYRMTPQDLQAWLECKRPDRHQREHKSMR